MPDTLSPPSGIAPTAPKGLAARIVGVIVSPRETYAAIAARPRVLGVLALVTIVTAAAVFAFLSTEVGQKAMLDQQMRGHGIVRRSICRTRCTTRWKLAPDARAITRRARSLVVGPLVCAGRRRHRAAASSTPSSAATRRSSRSFAIVAHSGVLLALQQLFVLPLDYVRESMSSPTNLAVFLPFLDETSFLARLLGSIDLFRIWWLVSLAIGARGLLQAEDAADRLDADRRVRGCSHSSSRRCRRVLRRSLDDPEEDPHRSSASSSSAAAVVAANLYFKRENVARRHDRGHQDARPRGDRVGVGQDSAEAARQHQRRHPRPRRQPGGQRRRPRHAAVSSCCRSIRKSLRTRVDSGTASLEAAASVARTDAAVGRDGARAARAGAAEPRAPARPLEAAAHDARSAREGRERRARRGVGAAGAREAGRRPGGRIAQERASLESARYDLSKVRIESPIDGIVTRRNIQEGETAVIGTMNNAGTVLLTLADMSVIQAEVEVDETNIPHVPLGQLAKITIDAMPDRTLHGQRHRDRQQPDSGGRRRRLAAGDQLQGGGRARRRHPRRPARLHLHGRHHDRDAEERHRGADSGGRRARAGLRRATARSSASSATAAGGAAERGLGDRPSPRPPNCRPGRRGRKPRACSSCARAGPSSCRSRWASPATSTSRSCRA